VTDERDPHRPAADVGDGPAWTWGQAPPPPPDEDATWVAPSTDPGPATQPLHPYGSPQVSPYGQAGGPAPYQQPASTSPYGQQPYGRQPYGASPYAGIKPGSPYDALPPGAYPLPMAARRSCPGTVVAAAVLTFVFAGIATMYLLVVGIIGAFVALVFGAADSSAPGMGQFGLALGAVAAVFLLLGVWAIAACVMAGFVLRGSPAARIQLSVSAVLTAALCVVGVIAEPSGDVSGVLLTWVVVCVGVVVLLFVGPAGPWFRDRGGRSAVAMTPGYGGHEHGGQPPASWR